MAKFFLLCFLVCVCFANCAKLSSDSINIDHDINENDNRFKNEGISQELKDYIDKRLSENDERYTNEINELKQYMNKQDSKISRLEQEVKELKRKCEREERSKWNDGNRNSPQTPEHTTTGDETYTESVVMPREDKHMIRNRINDVNRNRVSENRKLYP